MPCAARRRLCQSDGISPLAPPIGPVCEYHPDGVVLELHHLPGLDHLYGSIRSALPGLGLECRLQRDDLGRRPWRVDSRGAVRLHRYVSARLVAERRRCLGRQCAGFRAAGMVGVVSPACAQPGRLSRTAGFLPVATTANLAYCAGPQWAAQRNCCYEGANRVGAVRTMARSDHWCWVSRPKSDHTRLIHMICGDKSPHASRSPPLTKGECLKSSQGVVREWSK